MTPTEQFIDRLIRLEEGELSLLRRSFGQSLDADLSAFDLFTGLWWPMRRENPKTPQRWCSWLTAKLYGAFPFPLSDRSLPAAVGPLEPPPERRGPSWDTKNRDRFRGRFDALLTCSAQDLLLESHLHWCLRQIADRSPRYRDINWVELLDDLWRWDRPLNPRNPDDRRRVRFHGQRCPCRSQHFTVQEVWACEYLSPIVATSPGLAEGADHD